MPEVYCLESVVCGLPTYLETKYGILWWEKSYLAIDIEEDNISKSSYISIVSCLVGCWELFHWLQISTKTHDGRLTFATLMLMYWKTTIYSLISYIGKFLCSIFAN